MPFEIPPLPLTPLFGDFPFTLTLVIRVLLYLKLNNSKHPLTNKLSAPENMN